MRVRAGDVEDVHGGVFDEFLVGPVCCWFRVWLGGADDLVDESFCVLLGGAGCNGCYDMEQVLRSSGLRVDEEVFDE